MAACVKYEPESLKIHTYIVQAYIAYGEPKLAFEHIDKNIKFIGEKRVFSIYSGIMPICNDFADEPTMQLVIENAEKVITKDGLTTTSLASVFSFRCKMVEYYIAKNKHREALKQVDDELKKFDKEISKAKSLDDLKGKSKDQISFETDANLQVAKLPIYVLRARSNIAMGKRKDDVLYGDFLALKEAIEKQKYKESALESKKTQCISKIYDSMSQVARQAGDTTKSEEYKKLAKDVLAVK